MSSHSREASARGSSSAVSFVRCRPAHVTAVVNTGDDLDVHGLRVCPDLDSVTYWLGDAFDRDRGWGRRDETFRATEELRTFDPDAAWFGLGDLDLATHLFRTRSLAEGLHALRRDLAGRVRAFEIAIHDPADDRATGRDAPRRGLLGREMDLHFQEYWVRRGARDDVKAIRFEGSGRRLAGARGDGRDRARGRGRDLPLQPRRVDRSDPGARGRREAVGARSPSSGSHRSSAGGRWPGWRTG